MSERSVENRPGANPPPDLAAAERAVRERPGDAHAHMDLGLAFALAGDAERGLESFEAAARLDPSSAAIRYNIAVCHREAGRLLEAAESFARATRLDEDSYPAWLGRAGILARLGDTAGAREAVHTAARLRPSEKDPWRLMVAAELLERDFPALDLALEGYRSRGGDAAVLFFELRELFGEQRSVELAGAMRNRRATLAAEAAVFLGDHFIHRKDADAAIACLLDARVLGRETAKTMILLSRAYALGGRPIEAEAAIRLATSLEPENLEAWMGRARLLRIVGKRGEAVEAYRTAIAVAPENGIAWYDLGLPLVEAGQTEEAIHAYREAARLGPEFSRALNNLGWVYQSSGREDEARRAYEGAIRANPDNGRAWGNLGRLLAQQGAIESAVRCLREAIRLRPDRVDLALELLELESQVPRAEA
jgi:tetratricopeptide (TPR) repeat protein